MRIGIGHPNEHLLPGELETILNLGCRAHLLYLPIEQLGYWAGVAEAIPPTADVHLRIERRGAFGNPADDATIVNRVGAAIPRATTVRIRNEPNLESPGETPTTWTNYLEGFLRLVDRSRVLIPAIAPWAPGWLDWLEATLRVARSWQVPAVDAHLYGDVVEIAGLLTEYRRRWAGPLVVTETTWHPGYTVDVAAYARTLPEVARTMTAGGVSAACWFIWRWTHPDRVQGTPMDLADTPMAEAISRLGGEVMAVDYAGAVWKNSPNFGYPTGTPGRAGHLPVAIVEHMAGGGASAVEATFSNLAEQKSAQYFVLKTGVVQQWVLEANTSYGCVWNHPDMSIPWIAYDYPRGVKANLLVINIEHEGLLGEALTEAQYQATLSLHRSIFKRTGWPLTSDRIVRHGQIDSINKQFDPGAGFPMARLWTNLRAPAPPPGPTAAELQARIDRAIRVLQGLA